MKHLHLDVPSRDAAHDAAAIIEEALRAVSLPGDGLPGRVVYRRLDLGEIDRHVSAAALSRRVRSLVASMWSSVAPIDDARAATAPAVFARSDDDVLVALALRVTRGESGRAWFWPRFVPGWSPAAPRSVQRRKILDALHAASEVTPARLFAAMVAAHPNAPEALDAWVEALTVRDVEVWSRRAGWRRTAGPTPLESVPAVTAAWRSVLARAVRRWSFEAPRVRWLAGAALDAARPASASESSIDVLLEWVVARVEARSGEVGPESAAQRARRSVRREAEAGGAARDTRETGALDSGANERLTIDAPSVEEAPEAIAASPYAASPDAAHRSADTEPPRRAPRSEAEAQVAAAPPPPTSRPAPLAPEWPPLAQPEGTAAGGLYFLLPLLARLGVADAAVDPHRVLAAVARAVAIDPADPILSALSVRPEALFSKDARHDADVTAIAWVWAVGRWLSRYAELELAELVLRPAAVLVTATHLDVVFDLEDSDIRVRRAGLDLDPGWVPWFGRVVAFHYVHGGRP